MHSFLCEYRSVDVVEGLSWSEDSLGCWASPAPCLRQVSGVCQGAVYSKLAGPRASSRLLSPSPSHPRSVVIIDVHHCCSFDVGSKIQIQVTSPVWPKQSI